MSLCLIDELEKTIFDYNVLADCASRTRDRLAKSQTRLKFGCLHDCVR